MIAMRRILSTFCVFPLLLALLLVLLPGVARAVDGDPPPTPVMKAVQPAEVKPGGTVEVEGEYLGKKHVSEVYLTAGGNDIKMSIVTQDDKKLELKVPGSAPAGKYFLMVLTNRPIPNFIEQPVSIKVE
jgi:hypothetical protein